LEYATLIRVFFWCYIYLGWNASPT